MSRNAADIAGELRSAGLRAAFDHVAVAARRLRDLLPVYYELLGGTFVDGGDNERVGYRAVQLRYSNGGKVELMEPLEGAVFFDKFFASRGEGAHHVTFLVEDARRAADLLAARGLTATRPYYEDPSWREVFIHPKEANGMLIQLAQPGERDANYPRDLTLEDVLEGHGNFGTGRASG